MSDKVVIHNGELRATVRTDGGHGVVVRLAASEMGLVLDITPIFGVHVFLTPDDVQAIGEAVKSLGERAAESFQ